MTHKNLSKAIRILIAVIILFFIFSTTKNISNIPVVRAATADEITQLQEQIKKQQEDIQKLEDQKKIYQQKIDLKRKEAVSLKNQMSIIDNQIAKTRTEIKEKEAKIKETELSIKNIQIKVQDQRRQIDVRRDQISKLLQMINRLDRKSHLEIILLNGSVSDFLNQAKYVENLQSNLQENVEKIKIIQEGLESQENDLIIKRGDLVNLQNDLVDRKQQLSLERGGKTKLLTETRDAEWKFQSLLAEAVREQKQAESDIVATEKLIRTKLAAKKEQEMMQRLEEGGGPLVFSWPVPQDTITTTFHDPEYPFRKWLGEHPGIDIRAEQGTRVRAPASAYVAKVKSAGMGYSYVMLIHNDGFATVYGHLSEITVEENTYVRRGQMIGKSGGLPGTPGAGRFSTGPHLHFEVRLNGIPVNPVDYLI